ncbi:unnamed protein product, partial [Didymodactylos carnosus]
MTKTYIILIILYYSNLTLTLPNEEFDCNGFEDDSYHPFYDDCLHYWHCLYVGTVYQRSVLRECPEGTEFDTDLKKCETAVLVTCLPRPSRPSTTVRRKWKFSRRTYHRPSKSTVSTAKISSVFKERLATKIYVKKLNVKEHFRVSTNRYFQHATISDENQFNQTTLPVITVDYQALTTLPVFPSSWFTPKQLLQPGEPNKEADFYSSTSPGITASTFLITTSATINSKVVRDSITLSKLSVKNKASPISNVPAIIMTNVASIELRHSTIEDQLDFKETTEAIPIIKHHTSKKLITITSLTTNSPVIDHLDHDHHHQENNSIQLLSNDIINARHIIHQLRSRPRRSNMTLYVLTSNEHKIRRFSLNHTRGVLMPLNLCRSRRLRDMSNIKASDI